MAKSPFTRRDEQYELSRRALIKWTIAAGAGLGVARSSVHELLEKYAGKGIAQAAGTRAVSNSVVLVEAVGGHAWNTQIFAQSKVAGGAATNSWRKGLDGQPGRMFPGTDFPSWTYDGDPFAGVSAKFRPASFTAGRNQTHGDENGLDTFVMGGKSLPAFAAELQAASVSSVVPGLTINVNPGPSSVQFASANSVGAAINLFDSEASKSLLLVQNQAELYASHFAILAGLNKVANNSKNSKNIAIDSSKLLGKNLAAQLAVTPADVMRYVGTTTVPNGVLRYVQGFAFTIKAMRLGLTPNVSFKGASDDPHGAFDNAPNGVNLIPPLLWKAYKTFLSELESTMDPITQEPLARHFVMAVVGDTTKNHFNQGGWPDSSTMGSNQVFLPFHGGWVKSGEHGTIAPNAVTILNAAGQEVPFNGPAGTRAALASFAFALTKGDTRAFQSFIPGNLDDLKVHWNLPVT
jgi:hypothetical protein